MTFDTRAALDAILPALDRGDAKSGQWPDHNGEYWALCPFHRDTLVGNFSVSERGFTCFSCGAAGGLRKLAEKLGVDLGLTKDDAKAEVGKGFTLAEYAEAKHLPAQWLKDTFSLGDRKRGNATAIRMPYFDKEGAELCTRYRVALAGDKFRWAKGSKLAPYGLWLLGDAADVILVEGESDTHTLAYHGIAALGVPGAQNWKPAWAEHLKGRTVFAWQESDAAGAQFVAKIGADLPDARIITAPAGYKDVSATHCAGEDVPALVAKLKAEARPWRALAAETLSAQAQEAEHAAAGLLRRPDILSAYGDLLRRLGLVGEDRNGQLIFLALITRLLDRPVSVAVKGPSSGGKSFTAETVLSTCPASAYYALSSMSEHALAYDDEPLKHRFLVIYEAAGLGGDLATYLLRSLLSENRVRYLTIEKGQDGLKPRLIEREGPTGLLITTTWAAMHPENETRLLSLTVRDDRDQTRGVLHALADRVNGNDPEAVDLAPWHALQSWLELAGVRDVTIPYAHDLAAKADPRAVRLRRDFGAILALIRAHAILHQATRDRDARGRIVATLGDYRAVYDLIIDIVSQGVQATVSPALRETVKAVAEIETETGLPVGVTQLADRLGIDKAAASRRVNVALQGEYLIDTADRDQKGKRRRGYPAKLTVGDPLPADRPVLPAPADLENSLLGIPPDNTSSGQHLAEAEREVFEL